MLVRTRNDNKAGQFRFGTPNSKLRTKNFGLRMFHDDAGDDVGSLISPVGSVAEMAINLTHLKHVNRICSLEEISQR